MSAYKKHDMHTLDIIIETPRGYSEKFNFDPATNRFKLKKLLPEGMIFPYDFGFIPETKGDDGDPLDALVLSEIKSFPGVVIECRLIGALVCEQTQGDKKIRNDRFIFIPVVSKLYDGVKSLDDLHHDMIVALAAFFEQYNKLEKKEFEVVKKINAQQAFLLIKKSHE